MIRKSYVISILFVSVMFLGTVGCGSDVEKPETSIVDPSIPLSSKEDLLGSWEIVSVNGKNPQAFYQSLGREEGTEAKLKQFNCVFASDDSWNWNFELEFASDEPPREVEVIAAWSGTYVVESSTLFLIMEEKNVNIKVEPQEEDHEEDEQAFIEGVKPIKQATVNIQRDTLLLITPAAKKLVFKKQ